MSCEYTGSLDWKAVYTVGSVHRGYKFFQFIINTDQSEKNNSHKINKSLKLTNHKRLTAKYPTMVK